MSAFSSMPRVIEPVDLLPLLAVPELILVDLGKAERYAQAHIPGARHLDVARLHQSNTPTPGLLPELTELEKLLGALGHRPDAVYVIYDDEGGTAAGRFAWLLDMLGHSQWHYINGGWTAWTSSGLEQSSLLPSVTATQVRVKLQDSPVASREYLQSRLGAADLAIWDARSPDEYHGVLLRATRGGHIPGAINLEWSQGLDRENGLRIRQDIAELLKQHGITPDKEVITHCQTHRRSGFTYLVARALGYPRIKAYAGSWSEWGNLPDTPIES